MPGFLYRMPAGIPGDVSRIESATIEAQLLSPAVGGTAPPQFFGTAGVIDATGGYFRAPISSDTNIYGFLVRAYPVQGGQADPFGGGTVPSQGEANVMRRGYMQVTLYNTTVPVKGGLVYVRLVTSGSYPAGGVEAASGANLLALPATTCYFMGPPDANGITEIAFNI